jgi:signal transduction histidine kinase/ligand-binding sensor domain-containing protein/DNA-binding response OmpR family regulator
MKLQKTIYILLTLIFLSAELQAELNCHFHHYSTEDGLPQYTIMDILQDKKGFMWFGTWDGLSKFDGYKFRNYKVKPGDIYYMKSNRIERVLDDKYGRIWVKTYDGEYHCFNPDNRKFWGVQLVRDLKTAPFNTTNIQIMPSGKVWYLSDINGCILVKDSLFNTLTFDKTKGNLKSETVNAVYEDEQNNSWLLTNNGICQVSGKTFGTSFYFTESDTKSVSAGQSFYSATDMGGFILFGSENGRLWRYNKTNGIFKLLQLPVHSKITKILKFNVNKVVIVTSDDGFLTLNTGNNNFKQFNKQTLAGLRSNQIIETFLIRSHDLWFDTPGVGIYKFDLNEERLSYFNVETYDAATAVFPPRTMVFEDINGRLWIQPRGGGFSLYNTATNKLDHFYNDRNSSNWLFSNLIHSACSDRQGNLWLCTRSHGLEKIVFDKNMFRTKRINPESNSAITNDVRAVFEDKSLNLWVATKDRRLSVWDKNKKLIGRLNTDGRLLPDAHLPAVVYSIMQDNAGYIWLGTKGDGLYRLKNQGGLNHFSLEHFPNNKDDVYSLSDNSVYSIFQDSRNHIWIGTYGGGLNLVQQNQNGKIAFINHRNNLKNYPVDNAYRLRFITQNHQGNICVGSTGGLIVFAPDFKSPENIVFKTYARKPGDKESLSNNDVHGILITRKGEMFVATFGGGINRVTEFDAKGFPARFKAYTSSDGLPSDVTLALLEDEFGKIWITSDNNLTKFDPEKVVFENFAEIKRMMANNSFSEASNFIMKSKDLVFGYSNGLVVFSPRQIINNTYKPYIAFSGLQIFNKTIEPEEKNSPLTHDIDAMKKLTLTHKQNFISIEYAALDYVDPENILYAYKLEGFDQDWNYAQKQRVANYTNLPKGNYVFKVRSTNSEGVWADNERMLQIRVMPSFWETIWAYLIYLLIFGGIIYSIVRILFTIYRLRGNVEIEKKMAEMKLRFFTDISHEIRTPLTMISAPVDFMLNDSKTPEDIKKQLKTVSQNTNRMLRLVNQILDFRKIQFLHLKVREIEFAPFVEQICDSFSEIAENQHLRFRFSNRAANEKVWVDPDCLEKIVMNLLSNAFKYTAPGKTIHVTTKTDEKYVSVEVRDQGSGFARDKQKNLFVRFSSFNQDKSKPSTGIGLSIVKDLADKHNARISVESEEGKGSSFTVSFLKGIAHFDKNVEIIAADQLTENEHEINPRNLPEISENTRQLPEKHDGKHSVLIVEDDEDLRHFIADIIQDDYIVYQATDGKDGIEKALKYIPDFIVSDIMMPNVDGVELLQSLKSNINTSHIPIVLLTAKTTIESKLEGLTFGADDYITKPFSVPYFKARISNLISQRKHLQEIFRSELSKPDTGYNPQPYAITSQDEELMKKVMAIIEENMENTEFSVEELGLNMMMSRSVFFKKVKGLTGLAPVEFIRDVKMKRAAQILASGQYMVKEVSYLVGISDTKYFAKCFKAKYGVTPLEYKNQHQK